MGKLKFTESMARDCVKEMVEKWTADRTLWPESQAVMAKAPKEFAIYLRKALGAGQWRRNAVICNKCGDLIESKSVHHFNTCSCNATSVDGGSFYLKRMGTDFEDVSVRWPWIEDER
mgnify:FL=1